MNFSPKTWLAAAGLLAAFGAQAQQLPAGAPAGTTVQCKDGSFASPDTKSGACRGHKGIQTWYGKAEAQPYGYELPAVWPQARALPQKTRVVIDTLAERLPPLLALR